MAGGEGSRKERVERGGRLGKVWEGGWGSVISSAWSCLPFPTGFPEGDAHALLCRSGMVSSGSSCCFCLGMSLATRLVLPQAWEMERGCNLSLHTPIQGIYSGLYIYKGIS